MELRLDYLPDRQFLALRFGPGEFESVPIFRELRFWGVDRAPCPDLSALAAMIVLKNYNIQSLTLCGVAISPPVCTALSRHFEVEIHPETYDANRRNLPGGDKIIVPARFTRSVENQLSVDGAEMLTWISLRDMFGPLGGTIRTNIEFDCQWYKR